MWKKVVLIVVISLFAVSVLAFAESPFAGFKKVSEGIKKAKEAKKLYITLKEIPGLEKYDGTDFDPTKNDKAQFKYMYMIWNDPKIDPMGKNAAVLKLSLDFAQKVAESPKSTAEDVSVALNTVAMVETDAAKMLETLPTKEKVLGGLAINALTGQKPDDTMLEVAKTLSTDMTLLYGNAPKIKLDLQKKAEALKSPADGGAPAASPTPAPGSEK